MSKDKLDKMFERQKKVQELLHNDVKSQKFINEMVLALMVEAGEAIQTTDWKTWRPNQKTSMIKFRKEVIDILHFAINLCIAATITDEEVYKLFMQKSRLNIRRFIKVQKAKNGKYADS